MVARAAPGLQQILAQALEAGGWFAESHQAGVSGALAIEDPEERGRADADAARRGGADGNDGWGGRRLGIGGGTAKEE